MDNTDPLLNPESLQPHTIPNPNGQIPPQPTRPTMTTRMSIFPRAIGERCQGFMYPPKVGMHRRSVGASSSGGSSSSSHRTSTTILCGSTLSPPSPNVISPLPASTSHASPSLASSSVGSTLPPTPTRFITHSFLVIPDGTQWISNGVPSINHWPSNPSTVVLSLHDSQKWASVHYPHQFPKDSVEYCVAEAFSRLP